MRPEEDGFYVRLHPRPKAQPTMVVGVLVGFGLVGGVLGVLTSPEPVVRLWVGIGSVAFGLLLWGFSFGQGFFPVELIGDQRVLSWAGERHSWSQIGDCKADESTLRLLGVHGQVLAEVRHVVPEAAAWTAALVRASLEPQER